MKQAGIGKGQISTVPLRRLQIKSDIFQALALAIDPCDFIPKLFNVSLPLQHRITVSIEPITD